MNARAGCALQHGVLLAAAGVVGRHVHDGPVEMQSEFLFRKPALVLQPPHCSPVPAEQEAALAVKRDDL